MASPFVDEEEIRQILAQIDAEGTRNADFSPQTVTSNPNGPGRDESIPAPVVGDRELAAGLRDSHVGIQPDYEDEHVDATAKAPEPDRPQFGKIPNFDENGKVIQNFKTEEIAGLLKELEAAQGKDKTKKKGDRRRAYALNAGEAVSSAFSNRPGQFQDIPAAFDESKAVMDKAGLSNKLQTDEMKRRNPAEERELKDVLERLKLTEKATLAANEADRKNKDREDKQTHDSGERGKDRGLKASEGEKDRRAGVVGKVIGLGKGDRAGAQGMKEEATESRHQHRDYVYEHPVTDAVYHDADKMISSKDRTKMLAEQAYETLSQDPYAAAFWGTDARAKLKGVIMSVADANVKFGGNGVANGKDIENSLRMMGNLDSAESFISQNGLATLRQFIDNLDAQTDSAMFSRGARRRKPGEAYNQLPDPKKYGSGSGGFGPANQTDIDAATKFIEKGSGNPGVTPTPASPQTEPKPRRKRIVNGKLTWE